jgi:predicted dithiol-disulfide oxidoreductase (DUF899 family)
MSGGRYPNESKEYRAARDTLLKEEQELVEKTKAVAAKRRQLPRGGELKEDYVFQWANEGKVGKSAKFSELFGDKNTLLLYSFMFGPSWDKPCPSCTSLMDGFDRTWYSVTESGAAFVALAKAQPERIQAWAKERGWSQIPLLSGFNSPFQADYKCQESDDKQWPVMLTFKKEGGETFLFWSTENMSNHVDTVWPYWNLMDFTPEGRPDLDTPPQTFRSRYLEEHYLNEG